MPTPTEICNLALQHLGESQITSIDDTGDKISRTCKINYPQARDEVLASVPWASAKDQASLAKLATVPAYKWKAAYQLPADFIRLCSIEQRWCWNPSEYFDRMGNKLFLDASWWESEPLDSINIQYVKRVEDSTQFDPLMVECISLVLAAKMARTITGSDSKANTLRQEYEQVALPRARTVNAQDLYSGKNHPLAQMLGRSTLNRGIGSLSHVGIEPW